MLNECVKNRIGQKGGIYVGMSDIQYKGWLIDQLREWKRVSILAEKNSDTEVKQLADEMIHDIQLKLKT